jgi:hypothetical protein
MGMEQDAVEAEPDLLCPHCESSIEKVQGVRREFTERSLGGLRASVVAIACPTCHSCLGFYHPL